jgi:hypothetical protein
MEKLSFQLDYRTINEKEHEEYAFFILSKSKIRIDSGSGK